MDDQTANEITDQDNAELHDIDLSDTPIVESIESFVPTDYAEGMVALVATKFRKKPVEIEAIKFTKYNVQEVREFLGDAATRWTFYHSNTNIQCGEFDYPREEITSVVDIQTPSGVVVSSSHNGDWIIKGIEGELYPCTDSIFQATYEEVPDE